MALLALAACSASGSFSTARPEPAAGQALSTQDPVDPYPGLALFYDGAWSYCFDDKCPSPSPIGTSGLQLDEAKVRGPDSEGRYQTVLEITNRTKNPVDFTVWMQWNGKQWDRVSHSIEAGKTYQFGLEVEKGDAAGAEWHVQAADDPVIKINYGFPVKPVGA